MKEVLLPIGTVAEIKNDEEKLAQYLIIGVRQYNPNSGKAWDYISVPYPDGYDMNCKTEHPYDNNNLYFFNHIDIEKALKVVNSEGEKI